MSLELKQIPAKFSADRNQPAYLEIQNGLVGRDTRYRSRRPSLTSS